MTSEAAVRLAAFAAAAAVLLVAEAVCPRRTDQRRRTRWPNNFGVLIVDVLAARLVLPAGLVGVALIAETRGWGLFRIVQAPVPVATVLTFFLLDLAVYAQHVLLHAVPALWRLHRMHHTDVAFDATTGVRFHPAEIVLSLALKGAAVAALGAAPAVVLVFEVVLNVTSMFSHANIRLAGPLDRALRTVLVTPDMHRVHQSPAPVETNSNYGFNVPWWDYLFGTYRAQPQVPHDAMTIGLDEFRDAREQRLPQLLTQPFRRG